MDPSKHAFITLSAESSSVPHAVEPSFSLDCPYCQSPIKFKSRSGFLEYGPAKCAHIREIWTQTNYPLTLNVQFQRDPPPQRYKT